MVAFLVWKDRGGRTRVHQPDCQWQAPCQCPLRLAQGTADSLIGKLRSIFEENERSAEWQPLMGIGNPVADRSVKQYLANVREEQFKARVVLRQAEPFLVGDLATISEFMRGFKTVQAASHLRFLSPRGIKSSSSPCFLQHIRMLIC